MDALDFGSARTTIHFCESSAYFSEAGPGKTLIICDANTRVYAVEVEVEGRGVIVEIPPGEAHKRWTSIEAIINSALAEGMARDDTFFGLGGGVICDMAAFAASLYMRGCRLTLAPTTLLAMIDASIGGKTGIDHRGIKNLIGTFYPAERLLIAVDTLGTLGDREFRSGLAEGIKHGLLGDPDLLRLFESSVESVLARDLGVVESIVSRSIRVKGRIVEADPRETGCRAHLNLGHTFGHALEAATGFAVLTHGEAVAWGIGKAMKLGLLLGLTCRSYARRVWRVLSAYSFPLRGVTFDVGAVLRAMRSDKKRRGGEVRFVLQRDIANTLVEVVPDEIVRTVLEDESSIE